jgi:hypothetical protein
MTSFFRRRFEFGIKLATILGLFLALVVVPSIRGEEPQAGDKRPVQIPARSAAETKEASKARSGLSKSERQIVDKHRQLYDVSCIPMTVELVLKLTKHAPVSYFDLQNAWKNKFDGNFSDFDGKTIMGLTFHKQFGMPRDEDFPIGRLFATIDKELDARRFVIVSLPSTSGWHMHVICARDEAGDFIAFSKSGSQQTGSETTEERNLKKLIKSVHGTDIMTYEESKPPSTKKS